MNNFVKTRTQVKRTIMVSIYALVDATVKLVDKQTTIIFLQR